MAWDDRLKDFRERRERARAMGGAERFDEVLDPAHTRDVISRYLTMWDTRGAVGRHRLAAWPTKF